VVLREVGEPVFWAQMDGVSASGMVRLAAEADMDAAGRLLHDFNREFAEPTPP